MLKQALVGGYAIGYFEAWDQYSLEAVVEAAEEVRSPAIIGFGASTTKQSWLLKNGIENLSTLAYQMSKRSSVPTSVLFNEAQTFEEIKISIANGCNAVMLDSSHLSFPENVSCTKKVVDYAKPLDVAVEAELGRLPNIASPITEESIYTDPQEAAEFVEATGVDALAVSVGNVHLQLDEDKDANIDLELLERIRRLVNVPLVMHGGSGFPESVIKEAISFGIAKFNVGTCLKREFLLGAQMALAKVGNLHVQKIIGSREESDIMLAAKKKMKKEVIRLMNLYGSVKKANELDLSTEQDIGF